jgi:hypothetical protein
MFLNAIHELSKKYCYITMQNWQGESAKASGREPRTGLGRVFNYKLGCYDDVHVIMYTDAHTYL